LIQSTRPRIGHQVGAEAVGEVGVPTRRRDRTARRDDARAGHEALRDRIAQRDVRVRCRAEVAHGREAREQRALRVERAAQRVVCVVQLEALELGRRALLERQVDVQIHEPRQTGVLREVDRDVARAGREHARRHALDLVRRDRERVRPEQLRRARVHEVPALEQRVGAAGQRGKLGGGEHEQQRSDPTVHGDSFGARRRIFRRPRCRGQARRGTPAIPDEEHTRAESDPQPAARLGREVRRALECWRQVRLGEELALRRARRVPHARPGGHA
jgi:hypothetical protein